MTFGKTFGMAKVGNFWFQTRDGNSDALELFKRHYSFYEYKDGRQRKLFVGPGFKIVLLTEKADALFVWRKFISMDRQSGVNCSVFRNESSICSSVLILDAEKVVWSRWPNERLYTYVNPDKIKSRNPGYCFKMAGWSVCGETKSGLIVLDKMPVKIVQKKS